MGSGNFYDAGGLSDATYDTSIWSTTTLNAVPLTTRFVQPTSCNGNFVVTVPTTKILRTIQDQYNDETTTFTSSITFLISDNGPQSATACIPSGGEISGTITFHPGICPQGWTYYDMSNDYATDPVHSGSPLIYTTANCCQSGFQLDDPWVYGNKTRVFLESYNAGGLCTQTTTLSAEDGYLLPNATAIATATTGVQARDVTATASGTSGSGVYESGVTDDYGATSLSDATSIPPLVGKFIKAHKPWNVRWAASDRNSMAMSLPTLYDGMWVTSWVPGQPLNYSAAYIGDYQDAYTKVGFGIIIPFLIIGGLVTIFCGAGCVSHSYKKRKQQRLLHKNGGVEGGYALESVSDLSRKPVATGNSLATFESHDRAGDERTSLGRSQSDHGRSDGGYRDEPIHGGRDVRDFDQSVDGEPGEGLESHVTDGDAEYQNQAEERQHGDDDSTRCSGGNGQRGRVT